MHFLKLAVDWGSADNPVERGRQKEPCSPYEQKFHVKLTGTLGVAYTS